MIVEREVIGWREWIALPDLGVPWLKAKVDTGARTSALHAEELERLEIDGRPALRFTLFPEQRSRAGAIVATAPLIDERYITSSNGSRQLRPVIQTLLEIGGQRWEIELTLSSRDVMGFRMLLGRQAVRRRCLVDPGASFLTRQRKARPKRRRPAPR